MFYKTFFTRKFIQLTQVARVTWVMPVIGVMWVRDVLKKNAALIWTLSIRGGGSEANQKFWVTFCEPTFLAFLVEREGGFDQIQKFWDTFCQNMG